MAHIAIFVGSIASVNGQLEISGDARVSPGSEPVAWSTAVEFNAEASVMHQAIVDAAVAAAELLGYSIPVGHTKTVFAGISSQ